MSLPKLALLLAITAAPICVTESAQAQGLLGSLLRNAHPGPSSSPYGVRTPDVPVLELVMRLDKGKWVMEQAQATDAVPPSACHGAMPDDVKKMLVWDAAVKLTAFQQLGTNAFVVKDGIEANDPKWRFGIAVCPGAKPDTDAILHQQPESVLSSYGIDGTAMLASADDFIKQTDGSFPPPMTQAEIQQAKTDQKFMFLSVMYVANGEMAGMHEGLPFDTAEECDRYTTATIQRSLNQIHRQGKVVSNSVLLTNDDTGTFWFGCIHVRDDRSEALTQYFDVKMTPDKAKQMTRFPDLAHLDASPASAGSAKGRSDKF